MQLSKKNNFQCINDMHWGRGGCLLRRNKFVCFGFGFFFFVSVIEFLLFLI